MTTPDGSIKRPRGRPRKPNALSGAARMRRMRERAMTALNAPGGELASISDTALVELMRVPLRRGLTLDLVEILVEMTRRANTRVSRSEFQVEIMTRVNRPDGQWLRRVSVEEPVEESCNVTEKTEVKTEPPSAGRAWEYPPEIKARALHWKAKGNSLAEITQRIQAELGRAPGRENLGKLLKKWALDPAVTAILEQQTPTP